MTVIIMVALYFMYWVILVLPRSVAALWGFSLNVGIPYSFQVTTIPIHFLTDLTAAFAVKYLYLGLHLDGIS